MLEAVAQPCSSAALPSITRTVNILILAALMLSQTAAVRASICDGLVVERFAVLSPSVSRMMTLSTSGRTVWPWVSGSPGVKACQAQTAPIVTVVVPDGVIESTLASSAIQSPVSGKALVSEPQSATEKLVALAPG